MTRTERAIDMLLYVQRWPRSFEEIAARYPEVHERTIWRHVAELKRVAGMEKDDKGRYSIPIKVFFEPIGT